MAIDWNALLTSVTAATAAHNVPVLNGIAASVRWGSYYGPLVEGLLRSPDLAYVSFAYPSTGAVPKGSETTILESSVLVGFQVQIVEARLGQDSANPDRFDQETKVIQGQELTFIEAGRPAFEPEVGTVVHEEIVLTSPTGAGFGSPSWLLPAQRTLGSRFDVLSGVLAEGSAYTARARAILAYPYEDNDGIAPTWYVYDSAARPFFTEWGVASMAVNKPPEIKEMQINGRASASLRSDDEISFGFNLRNADGPNGFYRIQIGTTSVGSWVAAMWDSDWIHVGIGDRFVELPYRGPVLAGGNTYGWRVKARDGISETAWTAPSFFAINSPPAIPTFYVDGHDLISETPRAKASGATVTWGYSDVSDQAFAQLSYRSSQASEETEVYVDGPGTSVILPTFPAGDLVSLRLIVSDGQESTELTGQFIADSPPKVTSISIDGERNPVDMQDASPLIEWAYQDVDSSTQSGYRIQVSRDSAFFDLVWDTGEITGQAASVTYGTTASPLVAPSALTHGVYFVRMSVYDGVNWSELSVSPVSFFALNNAPNSPTITAPSSGTFDGPIVVSWSHASPTDADGDTIVYLLEVTDSRSTNRGWKRLAGPLSSTQTSYTIGRDDLPAGDDYGVRVIASDSFARSDASPGTSPAFSIANHAPVSPSFDLPQSGQVVSRVLLATWTESDPVDIDGDIVQYVVEVSSNCDSSNPYWERVAIFQAGTKECLIDFTQKRNANTYKLRITAVDENGAVGTPQLSSKFTVDNSVSLSDVERFNDQFYVATSDGRLMRFEDANWNTEEQWEGDRPGKMNLFATDNAVVQYVNGEVRFVNPKGESAFFRE